VTHLRSIALHPERYPTRERYPFNLSTLQGTRRLDFTTPVTLLVGENGSGKSTLLEAVAHRCGIHIWRNEERRRFEVNPYEQALCRFLTAQWAEGAVPGAFFGSSVFQDFARMLDEWAAADPGLLACHGARLYSFDQTPVALVRYEDTDHYLTMKSFLALR